MTYAPIGSALYPPFCMATGTPPICHRRVHNWIIGKHSHAGTGGIDRPPAGGASPALTTDPVTASGFVPMSVTASRAVCPGSISRWLGPAVIDHAGAGDVLRASRSYRGVGEVLAVHVRGGCRAQECPGL